jgi:hypothetical protein
MSKNHHVGIHSRGVRIGKVTQHGHAERQPAKREHNEAGEEAFGDS